MRAAGDVLVEEARVQQSHYTSRKIRRRILINPRIYHEVFVKS